MITKAVALLALPIMLQEIPVYQLFQMHLLEILVSLPSGKTMVMQYG